MHVLGRESARVRASLRGGAVPARLTIQAASRDAVWATFSDADGFPYLLRYRVGLRQ